MKPSHLSRRRFLGGALATGAAAFILPSLGCQSGTPRKVFSPNEKLAVGYIGVGGKGGHAVGQMTHEAFAAFCDVDDRQAADNYRKYPDVPRFKDYREMLEKMGDKLDAVVVSTPDHMHFPAAMACVAAGKHVYVEKPLTHTIAQARELARAVKKAGLVSQMGNHGCSMNGFVEIREIVEAGQLGEVSKVVCWTSRPSSDNGGALWTQGVTEVKKGPVPKEVNWKLWSGGQDDSAYSPDYLPFKWRGYYEWGCGAMGDMGCHILNPAFNSLQLGTPVTARAEVSERNTFSFPRKSKVVMGFPAKGRRGPVELTWYEGLSRETFSPEIENALAKIGAKNNGLAIFGRDAVLVCAEQPSRFAILGAKGGTFDAPRPAEVYARVADQHHYRNWTNAIRGKIPVTSSPFENAAILTEAALVGVVAQRVEGQVTWDTKRMSFPGNELATKLASSWKA